MKRLAFHSVVDAAEKSNQTNDWIVLKGCQNLKNLTLFGETICLVTYSATELTKLMRRLSIGEGMSFYYPLEKCLRPLYKK